MLMLKKKTLAFFIIFIKNKNDIFHFDKKVGYT